MKYVTFYWSILGGITDVEFFKTQEEALRNFRRNYKRYFTLNRRFCPRKTPCTYGFAHRKYICTTVADFDKFADNNIKKGKK